ncbi:MAG: hypothetical protein AAF388_11050 [Bacteroidota bacterium]
MKLWHLLSVLITLMFVVISCEEDDPITPDPEPEIGEEKIDTLTTPDGVQYCEYKSRLGGIFSGTYIQVIPFVFGRCYLSRSQLSIC